MTSSAKRGSARGFWYFKSKDAVLAALVRRLFTPEMRALQELPTRSGTAKDRLLLFSDDAAKKAASMVRTIPLTFELYSLAFRNKGVRKVLNEFFAMYLSNMREVIEQGVRAGEFPGADPARAAITLGAVIEGALLLWIFELRAVDLRAQIRSGVELVVKGLESGGKKRF
jgi:AcrR family transcriptional regulator